MTDETTLSWDEDGSKLRQSVIMPWQGLEQRPNKLERYLGPTKA
jgi:hypothetical protein